MRAKEIFDNLIDLLFPPKCTVCSSPGRQALCVKCLDSIAHIIPPYCSICGKPKDRYFRGDICEECGDDPPHFTLARSVAVYDGAIKDAIHHFKFNGRRSLAAQLGSMMSGYMFKGDIIISSIDAVIPVPLSQQRQKGRGYNQSLLLAEAVAVPCRMNIECAKLLKVKDVKPQFGLKRPERFANINGAFVSAGIKGANILLVDDIYTTGATVREAAKALREGGAGNVYVLTLARAVEDLHEKVYNP